MTEHKREDWRTCGNCVHRIICPTEIKGEGCEHHIYNADPKIYGDLQELIEPVCEWIKTHYPSDGKLIVDKCSATLEIPVHSVYSFEYIPEPPKLKSGETMITEEIFGVRLKMLLQERGLSQKAFARMIGVCTASMCKWIKGSQYPHLEHIIKMADALDISLDELCGRQNMQGQISVKDRLSEPPKGSDAE